MTWNSNQRAWRIAPAIQIWFLMPQIDWIVNKWLQSGAKRSPKNHQKSSKIDVGTFWDPIECTCAPNDHQNDTKVVPQDPKLLPKWCPRSRTIHKSGCKSAWNQISILLICECRFAWTHFKFCKILNNANPADPFRFQMTNLLLARGAGGRGEALRSAPTPQGVKGRVKQL